MIESPKPEQRDEKQLAEELRGRLAGYSPAWRPGSQGADAALLAIDARFLSVIGARLNQAPGKNLLAFLETAGVERIPAQSARAPLVCVINPTAADSRLSQGSRITARTPPGVKEELVFETETDMGPASAPLVEVVSVHPGRVQVARHSDAHKAGLPYEIFSNFESTEHILNLRHSRVLKLSGNVTLKVSFALAAGGSERLNIRWEYWDGKVWRPFENVLEKCGEEALEDLDGTDGLTQSGSVTLRAGCAETQLEVVNGVRTFWVRGRLLEPLPVDPSQVLPLAESVKLHTVITQPLRFADGSGAMTVKAGLLPDKAFAGAEALDLTKAFFPLGHQPVVGSAFYFTSAELFSKPK